MKKLVFDVGASAIKYALMDNDANFYEKGQIDTPKETLSAFIDALQSVYVQYEHDIDGIALSVPGTIDSTKGQIYAPGGLIYNENVNLADEIHHFTSVPVALENDGKSAALAEAWKGNLANEKDGIVIVLGSGIGGGIIKDGKLWKGVHLFAGEFSYVIQGEELSFYNVWALQGSTTALLMEVAKLKNMQLEELNGRMVFQMIEDHDEDACAALQKMAKNLARGIYNLQCILDPQKVLIGGGISQQPILLEKIKEELSKIYAMIPFEIPHAQVETCMYYNDSNMIGALYNYLQLHDQEGK